MSYNDESYSWIRCDVCGIETKVHRSKRALIEAWNRRSPPREMVEAWERLSHATETWGGTTVINGVIVGELMVMAQTVKQLCGVGKR